MNTQPSPYELGGMNASVSKPVGPIGWALFGAAFAFTTFRMRVGLAISSRLIIATNFIVLLIFHFLSNLQISFLFFHIGGAGTMSFLITAILYGTYAMFERQQRLAELRRGILSHTWQRGITRLLFLRCLGLQENHIYRFVEPSVIVLLGLCIYKAGWAGLGLWILFCAICAAIVESAAHTAALDAQFGALNQMVEAEAVGETLDHFNGRASNASPFATSPLPTGADPALAEIIAARRREEASR